MVLKRSSSPLDAILCRVPLYLLVRKEFIHNDNVADCGYYGRWNNNNGNL